MTGMSAGPAAPTADMAGDAAEFRLFCLALRRPFEPGQVALIDRAIAAGPDWQCLLDGARRHRVAAALLAGLQAGNRRDIPGKVVGELRDEARSAAMASLAQAREVARLTQLFSRAAVPMLVLKGVALSAALYGDPAQRHPRDIDLLVSPESFDRAEALLIDAGYRCTGPRLSPRQAGAYRRWVKDTSYIDPATGLQVELHHRLCDNSALLRLDFAELWAARDTVQIAGTAVRVLPRPWLPVYLAMHGAGHCWEELRWLLDFATALPEPADIDRALTKAELAGLTQTMLHALVLANRWLGLPIESAVLVRAVADSRVRRLDRLLASSYSRTTWHRTPSRRSFAGFLRYSVALRLYVYLLKPGWPYWKNQAVREWVTPADWRALPLPDRLFWAYVLVRPFGWLIRNWLPPRAR